MALENLLRQTPGRAGNKIIIFQHIRGQGALNRQGMPRRADAGHGTGKQFSVREDCFFCAGVQGQGGAELAVFHHAEQKLKRNRVKLRAQGRPFLTENPQNRRQQTQFRRTVAAGSIDFNHVNFSYKQGSGKNALSDIDLHIKSGETIGVIGGTGCGKSSLVNLICRLYDVDQGSVCVGGVDVRKYDTEALRNQVSVVLQKNTLFSGTILDNLRWGNPDATEEECARACRAACADEFIDRMPEGYKTRIERGGSNVSGGQKQRLCIARALLKKPKVLILDDSTSAVDTATDAKIRRAFAEEIPGTTKIIIAQRVSSVESADRILVLEEGRINAFDTHENLLKNNAIYQEIYTSQMEGGGDFDQPA